MTTSQQILTVSGAISLGEDGRRMMLANMFLFNFLF